MFLLDTNMASALIKGQSQPAIDRLSRTPTQDVSISVITEAEILFGLAKNPATKHAKPARAFLATATVMPWTSQTAFAYAQVRAALEAAGTPLTALDTLIGAHAWALGAVLVTADNAFRQIDGLAIENWLEGASVTAP